MELSLSQLQAFIDKIVREYKAYLEKSLDPKNVRAAIGYQISELKKYEHDRGHYPLRSITVIPNSSRIIDLLLIYNSEHGKIRFEFNIKPFTGDSLFTITKNLVSRYDEMEPASINTDIVMAFLVKKPIPLRDKGERSTRKEETTSRSFLCLTKDTNCCYLKRNHDQKNCSACCYDQPHSRV